jgi:hypothetical protein
MRIQDLIEVVSTGVMGKRLAGNSNELLTSIVECSYVGRAFIAPDLVRWDE